MFIYYRYLDQFKTRPVSIDDLFDYIDYVEVDSKVKIFQQAMESFQNGGS